MDILKENIIFHIFVFTQNGDKKHSEKAKEHLKDLAKKYRVKIKKQPITNLGEAFKDFIVNEKGYIETISKLYNSL